jgi:hypothetical protein
MTGWNWNNIHLLVLQLEHHDLLEQEPHMNDP